MMKLSEPLKTGRIDLKNRIMFPPMTTGYEKNGEISPQAIAFYSRLAKGGAGYLVLGDVSPIKSFSPTPKLYDDGMIEGFSALADAIHEYDAKIGVQIFHPEYDCDALNRLFAEKKFDEARARMHHDMDHFTDEVTEETLCSIIDRMCACAARAQRAGIDIIQIHGDRLTGTLCSSKMNHRTDRFGGSLENRTRFALMLVKAIRKAVPDMVIDYKLSVTTPSRGKGGVSREEAIRFAWWLEEAGVDMLHVAQANHTGNMADTIPPMGVQPYGFFVDVAGEVKQAVSIPVSCVGRIITPIMAERILDSGLADIVALGRPLLADPDWVKKAEDGDWDGIRPCISCNKGCTDRIQNREFLSCILNAENGFEGVRTIMPAKESKHIVVVGGGPAGLEAARVASQKGHRVTLFEKETHLGGQLTIACVPPRKEEMRRALWYLSEQMKQQSVVLRMGEAADEETVAALRPDGVIIATGAKNLIPPIKGSELPHVCDAWEVLAGKTIVYGRVCVVGGGLVGCETAEYLASRGFSVSIIEMLDSIAAGESSTVLPTLKKSYQTWGVAEYPGHTVKEITSKCVLCETKNGPVAIPCDYVAMAIGARPVPFASEKLEAAGITVIRIGDCADKPADISHAIRTAYDAANSLNG